MNLYLRRLTIATFLFAVSGAAIESAEASTLSLSPLTRYETSNDFSNGNQIPLDPPDKVYIYDYAVEHIAYLFAGVDGETVTTRFSGPDGHIVESTNVFDAGQNCWKEGNSCVLTGDGTVTTHFFMAGQLREDLGVWTYRLLNNGVVVYTENFTLVTPELSIAGGNNQDAPAGQLIPQRLEVRLLKDDGFTPLANESVQFVITSSPRIGKNGTAATLTSNGSGTGSSSLLAQTDSGGYAHAFLQLGSVEGDYQVTVTTAKAPFDAPVFTATAKAPTEESADDDKENGDPECAEGAGDPINLITGNVYQLQTDLPMVAPALLEFERHYNSRDPLVADMGWNWRHTYDRSIATETTGNGPSATTTAYVRRPDGKRYTYVEMDGNWVTDPDVHHTLTQDTSGWTFKEDNTSERFDLAGKLASITRIDGRSIQLTYSVSTGLLQSVDDDIGSWLQFTHNVDGQVETVTDQALRTWRYSYDTAGNLTGAENPDLTTRQYHYEDLNFPYALTGITDERGIRYSTWEYNVDGLASANYLAGNVGRVDASYFTSGARAVINSRSNTSNYQSTARHGSGFVTQLSGPGCGTCSVADSDYDYDVSNNLVKITSKGVTTTFGGYGSGDHPGYMIEAPGTVNEKRTDFSYDSRFDGLVTQIREPSVSNVTDWFHVTQNTYDDSGNITSIAESGYTPGWSPDSVALTSRVTTFAYNGPLGQLSLVNGPRTDVSDTTTLQYYPNDPLEGDNRARLRKIINAVGQVVRDNIEYTATGQVQSELRSNGLSMSYTYYSGNDRLETFTASVGGTLKVTRWTYLSTGEVTSITLGDGSVDATTVFFDFDDARRLTGIRDGLGNLHRFVLNTEGGVESEELYDPGLVLRHAISSVFDTYDRLLTQTSANESITNIYNADSSLASQTDGNNVTTIFTYDDVKRLTSISATVDGVLKTVAYDHYDDVDKKTEITPPGTLATVYSTDDFGNRQSTSNPNTGLTAVSHDLAGNVLQEQDSGGQIFLYQYDALNRLLSVDAPGTTDDVTYAYDTCLNGVGLLCGVSTASATVQYAYDGFGSIASAQNVSYTYDAAGRRKSITYPSGAVVDYSYGASGQIQSIQINGGPVFSNIGRVPFGTAITGWLFGNGLSYSATFDNAYRTTQQSTAGVLDRAYDSYDGNGNLLQMTETVSGVLTINLFSYTDDNRLATASGLFGTREYTYTPNGNRESMDDGAEVLPYANTNDQLFTIGTPPQVIGGETGGPETLVPGTSVNEDFAYDVRGNRVSRVENEWTCITTTTPDPRGGPDIITYDCTEAIVHNWVYAYTGFNRLQSVTLDGVVLASYEYNGLGQRTRKTLSDGTIIQFVYDLDGSLLAELDGAGTALREYVYLEGAPVVMRDLSAGTEKVYYIHNDHLGTPKAMTDNIGTVVWTASHDPFGGATVDEDPDGDATLVNLNIRFPGQYYDTETEFHYNYFRTYDSITGRYLQSDPIGLVGGLNVYEYVFSSPTAETDPSGLRPTGARPSPRRNYNLYSPSGYPASGSRYGVPPLQGLQAINNPLAPIRPWNGSANIIVRSALARERSRREWLLRDVEAARSAIETMNDLAEMSEFEAILSEMWNDIIGDPDEASSYWNEIIGDAEECVRPDILRRARLEPTIGPWTRIN